MGQGWRNMHGGGAKYKCTENSNNSNNKERVFINFAFQFL